MSCLGQKAVIRPPLPDRAPLHAQGQTEQQETSNNGLSHRTHMASLKFYNATPLMEKIIMNPIFRSDENQVCSQQVRLGKNSSSSKNIDNV